MSKKILTLASTVLSRKLHAVCNLLILFLILALGCATTQLASNRTSEESLREKVNQEWEAKVHNDWGVIYDLTSKEFKQTVERNKFIQEFIQGAYFKVLSFSIKELKVDEKQGKARAVVNFDVHRISESREHILGLILKGGSLAEE